MTYEALCVLCEAKGWILALSARHAGAEVKPLDPPCYIHALTIWWSRDEWSLHQEAAPIIVVLDDGMSLDIAADIVERKLHEEGVLK